MAHTSILAIAFFTTTTLLILSSMVGELQLTLCETVSVGFYCSLDAKHFTVIYSGFFGILSVVSGYRATSSIRVVMLGYRAYLKDRGLPKIHLASSMPAP